MHWWCLAASQLSRAERDCFGAVVTASSSHRRLERVRLVSEDASWEVVSLVDYDVSRRLVPSGASSGRCCRGDVLCRSPQRFFWQAVPVHLRGIDLGRLELERCDLAAALEDDAMRGPSEGDCRNRRI